MKPNPILLGLLFSFFCVSAPALCAPLLDDSANYAVNKELKSPGTPVKALESSYSETKINFQSFDLNDPSPQPLLASQTEQLVKTKVLPKDPKDQAAIKDGLDHRTELTFERLSTVNAVKVPGLRKPFETRSELGVFLMNKPIIVKGDGKVGKKVEGLDAIRAKMATELRDPIAQSTLNGLLKEDILLRVGAIGAGDTSCLSAFEKKLPGAKWRYSREEQGVKIEYECEFEGWTEVKGKKVAVVKVQSKKSKLQRQQPNGTPGMTETEISGSLIFVPDTQETMLKLETSVYAEPMEDEIARLKAKGAQIPRNRTRMWQTTRIYPL